MKNVVICAALNDESINSLKALKGSPLLKNAILHFVHCFEVHVYTSDFSPYIFPTEEKYPEIKEATTRVLDNLKDSICTDEEKKHCKTKVIFSQSPKQAVKEYLDEVKANLVIVATRGKHGIEGFFSSSFAEHLIKHSHCDVHILKSK